MPFFKSHFVFQNSSSISPYWSNKRYHRGKKKPCLLYVTWTIMATRKLKLYYKILMNNLELSVKFKSLVSPRLYSWIVAPFKKCNLLQFSQTPEKTSRSLSKYLIHQKGSLWTAAHKKREVHELSTRLLQSNTLTACYWPSLPQFSHK